MYLAENSVVDGRFRLNRLLGQGGMGAVWLATQIALDTPCALKFIEGSQAHLPEARARFEREAKAAAALKSPHVVQIIDYGIFEDVPWMAMELLQGEDLGSRITRQVRLPGAEVHRILNQVCRALTKAHALGIVHRDLKPDNIYLVRDDDREIAKVLDFGIAKQQRAELGGNTRTGAMLGTPYYMSPEQAQGTKAVDHRSDLWSLAVIAFQALTGQLPFQSDALGDLLIKIIVSDMPIPSQFGPAPPGFDAWWRRAASRNPAERFQSAKEFADSLAVVCQVSQISGVMDHASLGISASQLAPPRGPGSAMAMTPAPTSNTFSPQQAAAGKRPKTALFVSLGVVALLVVMGGIFVALRGVGHYPDSVTASPGAPSSVPSTSAAPPPEAVPAVAPAPTSPVTTAPSVVAPPATGSATPSPVAPAATTSTATHAAPRSTAPASTKPKPADLGF